MVALKYKIDIKLDDAGDEIHEFHPNKYPVLYSIFSKAQTRHEFNITGSMSRYNEFMTFLDSLYDKFKMDDNETGYTMDIKNTMDCRIFISYCKDNVVVSPDGTTFSLFVKSDALGDDPWY